MTINRDIYRIEDAATGETFFCEQKDCGSNFFFHNANGQLVCDACEEPALVRPTAVFVKRDVTQASERIADEAIR